MKRLLLFLLLALPATGVRAVTVDQVSQEVGDGHWRQAQQEIAAALQSTNLDFPTRQALLFQRDRMERMRLDFSKTREQVLQEARAVVPDFTAAQFAIWEKTGSVEFMEIDGRRWYFSNAAANLFRVNPEAKALKQRLYPNAPPELPYRPEDVPRVIAKYDQMGESLNSPRHFRVTYSLSVKPGAVPPGEIIRAWLPFPHAGNRQKDIRLISSEPSRCLLPNPNDALASVYLEQPALSGQPTEFKVVFEYTSDAFYRPLDAARVTPINLNDPALQPFLGEAPPHIVFSDEIKKLSREIVGNETNPCLIARRIFGWSNGHLPWAPAREYSTITSLPQYALSCGHGDCGIKTMTFMALCRFNGIPARWESGWVTGPMKDMHDWCEIYLAPYGWVPMDVTYGLTDSADERARWFYFGGIDADRLVLNTDYNQPLYPAKLFFRSEIVDFQRGEVEWRGGNLYFNQWRWDYQVEEVAAPAG